MNLREIFKPNIITAAFTAVSSAIGFSIPSYFELVPPASTFFVAFGWVMLVFTAIDLIGLLLRKL